MKTLLGTEIPKEVRGVLYLCHFNYALLTITVFKEILCIEAWSAIDLYANIPNPESQVATGGTYEVLYKCLEELHKNIKDKKWLKELSEQL